MSEVGVTSASSSCPVLEGYNPVDPDQLVDPFSFWAFARKESPVFFSPVLDSYVVTRYEDIQQVLGDPSTFSSANVLQRLHGNPPEVEAVLAQGYDPSKMGAIINLDPPLHTRVRRLTGTGFTPRRISVLENDIRDIADELIDAMKPATKAEFVSQFAYPLPLRIILRLLDLPSSQGDLLHHWSGQKLALQFGDLPPQEHLEVARDFIEFQRYIGAIVDERRQNPGDDLISVITQARDEDGEPLDEALIVGQVMGLVNAGHETITGTLTIALYYLLSDRLQWDALCADLTLAPAAVEEALRFDAPVKQLFRKTTQPATIGGVGIPEGARVAFVMGSANRDEAVFNEPDRFDIRVQRAPHLSFSRGIHFCLGASLARLQGRVALAQLAERLPSLRLAENLHLNFPPSIAIRGPLSLDVEWDA